MNTSLQPDYSFLPIYPAQANVSLFTEEINYNNLTDYNDDQNDSTGFTTDEIKQMIISNAHTKLFVNVFYVAYSLVSVLGTVGNALVCWVVARKRYMWTPRNILIANLSLTNFILSITVIPLLCIPEMNLEWIYGDHMCKFSNAFFGINVFCSALTIIAISVDRFFAIKNMSRKSCFNLKLIMVIVVLIWGVSLSLASPYVVYSALVPVFIPPLLPPDEVVFYYCQFKAPQMVERAVFGLQLAFQYCVPLVPVIFFNYILHRFLTDNAKRRKSTHANAFIPSSAQQQQHSPLKPSMVHLKVSQQLSNEPSSYAVDNKLESRPQVLGFAATGSGGSDSRVASPSNFLQITTPTAGDGKPLALNFPIPLSGFPETTSVHSFEQSDRRRAEKKRLKNRTSLLLLMMVLSYGILWLPFVILYIMADFTTMGEFFSHNSEQFAWFHNSFQAIAYSSLIVNPFLYGFLNLNFRREFRMIWDQVTNNCKIPAKFHTTPLNAPECTSMNLKLSFPQKVRNFKLRTNPSSMKLAKNPPKTLNGSKPVNGKITFNNNNNNNNNDKLNMNLYTDLNNSNLSTPLVLSPLIMEDSPSSFCVDSLNQKLSQTSESELLTFNFNLYQKHSALLGPNHEEFGKQDVLL